MRLLLLLILSLAPLTSALAAEPVDSGTIEVTISGLNVQPEGELRVGLFRSDSGWPKFKSAVQLKTLQVSNEQLKITFEKLPFADDYAIQVHHDQNGNGKFDMRWLPYPRPKEGVGVSNNVKGFGSPSFSAARFPLDGPEIKLSIQMRY